MRVASCAVPQHVEHVQDVAHIVFLDGVAENRKGIPVVLACTSIEHNVFGPPSRVRQDVVLFVYLWLHHVPNFSSQSAHRPRACAMFFFAVIVH